MRRRFRCSMLYALSDTFQLVCVLVKIQHPDLITMYSISNAKISETIIHLSYGYYIPINLPQNFVFFCQIRHTVTFSRPYIFLKRAWGLIHILYLETKFRFVHYPQLYFIFSVLIFYLSLLISLWILIQSSFVYDHLSQIYHPQYKVLFFLLIQVIFQEFLTKLNISIVAKFPPGILFLDVSTTRSCVPQQKTPYTWKYGNNINWSFINQKFQLWLMHLWNIAYSSCVLVFRHGPDVFVIRNSHYIAQI